MRRLLSIDIPCCIVVGPQGIASGLQGRRDHQGIEDRKGVTLGEVQSGGMVLDVDREKARTEGADRAERLADLRPGLPSLRRATLANSFSSWMRRGACGSPHRGRNFSRPAPEHP